VCNRLDCVNNMGKWVQFRTPWGSHRGIVTDVNNRAVLIRVPRQYAPVGLVSDSQIVEHDDEKKLDLALAQWGGYGVVAWGYPGYAAWWAGWLWWWLAFAWILALAFLW
jgi:hypothetical protein